jgi:hypothetical protein
MITFMDLGPKATAYLYLKVPVPMDGNSWTWGELPAYAGVLAREFVYTAQECAALIHAYGRILGTLLQSAAQPDRFTLTARGPITGKVLGLREWQYDGASHAYVPAGEYLCGWRASLRSYFEMTGELWGSQHFDAREGGLTVLAQSPCWANAA